MLGEKKKFKKRNGLKIWTLQIEEIVTTNQDEYKKYIQNPTEKNMN